MFSFHNDVEAKIFVTIHSFGEEFTSWLVSNLDIILCNMVVLTLHDNVKAKILVSIHSGSEEFTVWLHDIVLKSLLSYVVVLTLHDNVHAEVFVAVHTICEISL